MLKEKFTMEKISDLRKLQLAQNILPNGQGILHKLAMASNASVTHINKIATDMFAMTKIEQ